MKSTMYQLVKLPSEVQIILYLIKEELKSHKFFSALREIGLDDSYYQSELNPIILAHFDLDDESNETMDLYFALLEKYSRIIEPGNNSLQNEAFNFYVDLMMTKKKRSGAL